MRGSKTLSTICLTLAAIGLTAASAPAAGLVLKSGGSAVAAGTGTKGKLRFGPCGSFTSTGTLIDNNAMVDRAVFTTFENNPGGCGEGGPAATGQLESIQLSASGTITLTVAITYVTELPKKCEYTLARLTGKFALPGSTTATVSGTAKRVKSASEHGCKGSTHLTGEEAALDDLATGLPFEAEV
jgi:hypothetical protein